jgi:predicted phosphodiesterase
MAVSKERIGEIIEYSIENSEEKACETYSIPMETFNRYKREYKKYFGENAELFLKLRSQYTKEELKAISEGGRIIPGFKKAPIISFAGEEVVFGIMSDTHIGSVDTDDSFILKAFDEFAKRNCAFIVHNGDLVEGMMARPGHVYELSHIGFKAQRDKAIELFQQNKLKTYIIGGNHCDSFNTKLGAGIDIVEEVAKEVPGMEYIGKGEGDISINGVVIRSVHGGDSGASYALSYRPQKMIEAWTGGTKPHILTTGHDHKAFYMFYRNCHVVGGGCLQKQTGFMRGKRLAAHVGFWIVRMGIGHADVKWMEPRFYPFYQ